MVHGLPEPEEPLIAGNTVTRDEHFSSSSRSLPYHRPTVQQRRKASPFYI